MKKGDFTAEEIEILKSQRLSDDFISEIERVLLTYDDWLLSNWPVIWRGHGIKVLPYMEGEKVVKTIAFVIPPLEWQKVENKMRAILENYIQAYTDTLISYFESQYVGSLERKRLIQGEIEKIESLLFDPNWKGNYSAFGKNLVLAYRNDVPQYDSKLPYWYKKLCVDGGDGLSVIGPQDVSRKTTDLEKQSVHTHFATSAFAFHRFKKFLNDKLEFETPIVLTFEDWKLGTENWKDVESEPSKYPINQPFEEHPARRKDGQFRKYSLSPVEFHKIASSRKEIFERQVALFLRAQIEDFEQRFSNSLEKKSLLETELHNVNAWLSDKTLAGACVFPNPTGGSAIFGDFGGLARADGEDTNTFPKWYNKLIVQGKDASAFIEPGHDNDQSINSPIAVHVLYQYRQFLEGRTNETDYYILKKKIEERREANAPKATQMTLALFYFYQHQSGELERFASSSKTKTEEIKEIANRHNVGAKNFELAYNKISKKEDARLDFAKLSDFIRAVQMLSDFPKALALAKEELGKKKAKTE